MTRSLHLLAVPVAVVVILAVGAWLLRSPPSTITRENAATVQPGMTLAEVEVILGGPARNDSTGPLDLDGLSMLHGDDWMDASRGWRSDTAIVLVRLDDQSRVELVEVINVRRASLVEILRRWLGL